MESSSSDHAMRVLHVVVNLDADGPERAAVDLAAQREKGVGQHLTYLAGEAGALEAAKARGVKLHGPLGGGQAKACSAALRQMVEELKIDVVHSHLAPAAQWSVKASGGKVRMVHTVREPMGKLSWTARKLVWPKIVAKASRLVCECTSVEEEVVGRFPAAKGKVVVIPEGVDPARAKARRSQKDVRSEMGLPSDAIVVLQVADITDRSKGHLTLVEAMRQVCNEFPYTYLLIAGDTRNQGLVEEVKEKIHGLELHRRVKLLGRRDDVADLLGASDVFVMPSTRARAPVIIVEAMMAGLPVVTTAVGSCGEMVKDSETGIVVPPGEAGPLATAIMELSTNSMWRQKLADTGRERALSTYALARVGAMHAEMYRAMMDG